jgi:hypothetical protein
MASVVIHPPYLDIKNYYLYSGPYNPIAACHAAQGWTECEEDGPENVAILMDKAMIFDQRHNA